MSAISNLGNLVTQIKNTSLSSSARCTALDNLYTMSSVTENRPVMMERSSGLFPALIDVIKRDKGQERIKALNVIWWLTVTNDNRPIMASAEFGLLPLLVFVVGDDRGDARGPALNALQNLSASFENRPAMGERSLGIIPMATGVIKDSNQGHRVTALNIVQNLALALDISIQICNPNIGLLPELVRLLRDDTTECRKWAVCCLGFMAFNFYGHEECGQVLVASGAHQAALNHLKAVGPNKAKWPDKNNRGYLATSLDFIMRLSSLECAVGPLKAAGALEIIPPIAAIADNGSVSLRGLFTIAFLVGKQEGTSREASLMTARAHSLDLMLAVFQSVLDIADGTDYDFGQFRLRTMIHACLIMSISDTNKRNLATPTLLTLLMRVLTLFAENKPELIKTVQGGGSSNVGGGGNDVVCAELAIETLLQLSFVHEENSALTSQFMTPATGVLSMMERLQSNTKLTKAGLRNVSALLSRLRPEAARPAAPAPAPTPAPAPAQVAASSGQSAPVVSGPRSHIMISYCWRKEARPDLVVKMCGLLTQAGYDVWRDEVMINASITYYFQPYYIIRDVLTLCFSCRSIVRLAPRWCHRWQERRMKRWQRL